MRITIAGASGFIGKALVAHLEHAGHAIHILGRKPRKGLSPGASFSIWDPEREDPLAEGIASANAVIHLAGEPVAQRWTPSAKRHIRSSRVDGTQRLVKTLSSLARPPEILVTASAVGYYGDRADEVLGESSGPGAGFLPEVCVAWERAAETAVAAGIRVVMVRTGLVLGKDGGALDRMLPPFRIGLGGKLGSGRQWMPWIHLDDLCRLFEFALKTPRIHGPLNGVGPNPVRNAEFTVALGRALRRPAILPIPEFAIRILYGEMSQILFHSQRAMPLAAQEAGFQFHHPELFATLKEMVA
jgi:uncharacterized protein (TIGR01777 family)